jgi:hypothetical protein
VIRLADARLSASMQQLHQIVVGRVAGRLDHEHVLAADVLVDLDENLLVGEAPHARLGQRHFEIFGNRAGQRQIAVPGEQFHGGPGSPARAVRADPLASPMTVRKAKLPV